MVQVPTLRLTEDELTFLRRTPLLLTSQKVKTKQKHIEHSMCMFEEYR